MAGTPALLLDDLSRSLNEKSLVKRFSKTSKNWSLRNPLSDSLTYSSRTNYMQMPMIGVHRARYVVLRGARIIFPITEEGGHATRPAVCFLRQRRRSPRFYWALPRAAQ